MYCDSPIRHNHLSSLLNVFLRGRGWRDSSSLLLLYTCPDTFEHVGPQKKLLRDKSLLPYRDITFEWISAAFSHSHHKYQITAHFTSLIKTESGDDIFMMSQLAGNWCDRDKTTPRRSQKHQRNAYVPRCHSDNLQILLWWKCSFL